MLRSVVTILADLFRGQRRLLSPPRKIEHLPPAGLSKCPVCGADEFSFSPVLWKKLVREWKLSPEEEYAINLQQGYCCTKCGSNLRSMTLAAAILRIFNPSATFQELCSSDAEFRSMKVLEINEAGSLSRFTQNLPYRELARYPDVNMEKMPYHDATWDLILHSDTLEHVRHPETALAECFRTLKHKGFMAWTVPLLVGRMTRRRGIFRGSYHGAPDMRAPDYRVVTEYGADAWCEAMRAGFAEVSIFSLVYPACIAMMARKQ